MKIFFHKNFEKKFIKLSFKVQESFKNRCNLFMQNRYLHSLNNHPLRGDRKGQWSINITGDWRAIYFLKEKDIIVFIDIDTHSNLYK